MSTNKQKAVAAGYTVEKYHAVVGSKAWFWIWKSPSGHYAPNPYHSASDAWRAACESELHFNPNAPGYTACYLGRTRDTMAQGEKANVMGYDPTCIFCETGEEPGHEH